MSELENQSLTSSGPRSRVGAAVSARIKRQFEQVLNGFQNGQLSLTWPDGTTNVYGERSESLNQNANVVLHSYHPLQRLVTHGQIGFAESYLRCEWSTDNLHSLFSLIMRNKDRIRPVTRGGRLAQLLNSWQHWRNRNSLSGSRRNIAYHYDLGNAFYGCAIDQFIGCVRIDGSFGCLWQQRLCRC